MALTKAQRNFLQLLRDTDGAGVLRHMPSHHRKMAYRLKEAGLLLLDGAIASTVTEGNASYSGMTFVLTEAGLNALEDGS